MKKAIFTWDIWIFSIIIFANAGTIIIYHFYILDGVFLSNISSIYEKVKICLSSTSVLLAVSGILYSGFTKNEVVEKNKSQLLRSVLWLTVALLLGIFTVAIIPVHLPLDDFLSYKHVSLWLWLFVSGPGMYASLIIGIVWFVIMIYKLIYSNKSK